MIPSQTRPEDREPEIDAEPHIPRDACGDCGEICELKDGYVICPTCGPKEAP